MININNKILSNSLSAVMIFFNICEANLRDFHTYQAAFENQKKRLEFLRTFFSTQYQLKNNISHTQSRRKYQDQTYTHCTKF